MEQLVPIHQEFAVLRQLVSHAAPTVALAEDEDARRIVDCFVCEACKPRIHESPSPLFFLRRRCSAPPVACCQSALFHLCPAFPQGATAAKAVAESAFWRGTNQHSITPRLLRCCNCSRVSDKITDTSQPQIPQPSFFTW
jgi:hypothetical protein